MKPIDFLSSKLRYRIKNASLKREQLARAIGFKPKDNPRIVDATAGLGRDSLILAALGFNIIMLERSHMVFERLEATLIEARRDKELAPIVARLTLIHTDAVPWLHQCKNAERPDVVYLDPMFPPRKKAALVKKDMIWLQDLIEKDTESMDLLPTALACARNRVVVKRPRLAGNLNQMAPNFTLFGRSSRFDIYLV